MTESNPYSTPEVSEYKTSESVKIKDVATGQKMVIFGILCNFASIGVQSVHPALVIVTALAALVLSVVGIIRLAAAIGNNIIVKILLVLLMFVPLINIITLLMVNKRATKLLREHGYSVGLLGASKPDGDYDTNSDEEE